MPAELPCNHDELHWGSGCYYIFCRKCGRTWVGLRLDRTNDTDLARDLTYTPTRRNDA